LKVSKQAIWIDLDNSPHVPLFLPVIERYRKAGIDVIVTARDHSQTIQLLDIAGLGGKFDVVGRHAGKNKFRKVHALFSRAFQLISFIKKTGFAKDGIAVAVSHGSRSMVLAARWLRIPVITMYDYEFTETVIFNRLSNKVIVPDRIPDAVLDEIGLPPAKRWKYPGIKEELYVRKFQPTPDFRRLFFLEHGAGTPVEKVLAVIRPPATTANYHSEESDVLLDSILRFLFDAPDVFTVVVPRTVEQAKEIKSRIAGILQAQQRCLILDKAVNGLDLAFAADLLISGGGTMNREAALLGVPVYSIFAGRQGSLDRQMEKDGLITFIRDARDLSKVRLELRDSHLKTGLTDRVEKFVIEQIDSFL